MTVYAVYTVNLAPMHFSPEARKALFACNQLLEARYKRCDCLADTLIPTFLGQAAAVWAFPQWMPSLSTFLFFVNSDKDIFTSLAPACSERPLSAYCHPCNPSTSRLLWLGQQETQADKAGLLVSGSWFIFIFESDIILRLLLYYYYYSSCRYSMRKKKTHSVSAI